MRVAWCRQEYIARRLVNLQVARAFGGWAERARELLAPGYHAGMVLWQPAGEARATCLAWLCDREALFRNAVLCMHPPALASAFNQWCEVARGRREAAKRKTADEDFEKRLQQQLAARETTLQLEKAGLEEQLEQRSKRRRRQPRISWLSSGRSKRRGASYSSASHAPSVDGVR